MQTNKSANRESGRVKETNQKRVLDEASRKRRARKALETLEQDNFQDDPHADLVMSKKIPKFNDNLESRIGRKKKTKSVEYYKQRFRKSFDQLIEEVRGNSEDKNEYLAAEAPPPKTPARHFCAVCGLPSNYSCIPCGARYCSVSCLGTHLDTRCLKWIA